MLSSASHKKQQQQRRRVFRTVCHSFSGSFRGYIRRWLVSPCEDDDDGIRRRVFKDDGVVGGEGLGMKRGLLRRLFNQFTHW